MVIQCMICLSNILPSDVADSTDCGHVFHESCFNQWRLHSATCPQCRAICTGRNIRRLYFNTSVNELQRRQHILNQSVELLNILKCVCEFEIKRLDAATPVINNLKTEYERLGNLVKELEENTIQSQAIDDMKGVIESSANEEQQILNEIPDFLLPRMIVNLKSQLIIKEMKRKEVSNALNVCRAENRKLNVTKRQLHEKISTLENDNNKEN